MRKTLLWTLILTLLLLSGCKAEKKGQKLLANANTNDYYEHNIMEISPQNYPEMGLLKMK